MKELSWRDQSGSRQPKMVAEALEAILRAIYPQLTVCQVLCWNNIIYGLSNPQKHLPHLYHLHLRMRKLKFSEKNRWCVSPLMPPVKIPMRLVVENITCVLAHSSVGWKSGHSMAHLVLCPRVYRAEIKELAGLHSFLEAMGRNLLPSSLTMLAEFHSFQS